jgi:anti-anti-sigma factor
MDEAWRIETRKHGDATVVVPHGELDLSTAPTLDLALEAVSAADVVVLDLRGLTFIDSTGLRTVVRFYVRARERGERFVVVRGNPMVQRVFELAGLPDRLAMVPDQLMVIDDLDELDGLVAEA